MVSFAKDIAKAYILPCATDTWTDEVSHGQCTMSDGDGVLEDGAGNRGLETPTNDGRRSTSSQLESHQ